MINKVTGNDIVDKVTKGGEGAALINDIKRATNALIDGKEDTLGRPTQDGQMLVSTAAGARSWVPVAGGEDNVQVDWEEVDDTKDEFIKNKPTKVSQFENDSNFIPEAPADTNQYIRKDAGWEIITVDVTEAPIDGKQYVRSDAAWEEIVVEQSDWTETNTLSPAYIKNGIANAENFGIGAGAGETSQGVNAIALGINAGKTTQGTRSIAIGRDSGSSSQGSDAVALGNSAGKNTQANGGVAIGLNAGATSQGSHAVAVGPTSGNNSQGVETVSVGASAGRFSQGGYATAVGSRAGDNTQGDYATALGRDAGYSFQGSSTVSVGYAAGKTSQGASAVSVGSNAGWDTQGTKAVAVGSQAGYSNQGTSAIAIGENAGNASQSGWSVAIGHDAGKITQGEVSVAVGDQAGETNQASFAVAVGELSGNLNQGAEGTAVGPFAGQSTQGAGAVGVGIRAGQTTQGDTAVAVGSRAGQTSQGADSVAIGKDAGSATQGTLSVAVGPNSGKATQGVGAVSVGASAGETSQGTSAVAVGDQAGFSNQGVQGVALGNSAGKTTQGSYATAVGPLSGSTRQKTKAVAVGFSSGVTDQGESSVSVGDNAGNNTQGNFAVAVGTAAGQVTQRASAVAVGSYAGNNNQGINAVAVGNLSGASAQGSTAIAIGESAGKTGQGTGAIAIGSKAGETNQEAGGLDIKTALMNATYVPSTKNLDITNTTGDLALTVNGAPLGGGGAVNPPYSKMFIGALSETGKTTVDPQGFIDGSNTGLGIQTIRSKYLCPSSMYFEVTPLTASGPSAALQLLFAPTTGTTVDYTKGFGILIISTSGGYVQLGYIVDLEGNLVSNRSGVWETAQLPYTLNDVLGFEIDAVGNDVFITVTNITQGTSVQYTHNDGVTNYQDNFLDFTVYKTGLSEGTYSLNTGLRDFEGDSAGLPILDHLNLEVNPSILTLWTGSETSINAADHYKVVAAGSYYAWDQDSTTVSERVSVPNITYRHTTENTSGNFLANTLNLKATTVQPNVASITQLQFPVNLSADSVGLTNSTLVKLEYSPIA